MARFIRLTVGTLSDVPASEAFQDVIAAADSVAATTDWLRTPADVLGLTDSALSSYSLVRTLADSAGLSDAVLSEFASPGAVIPLAIPFTIGA